MNLRSLIFILLLSVCVMVPVAGYALFMPDDEEVQMLERLYARTGLVFPEASYPVSKADLDSCSSRLHRFLEHSAKDPAEAEFAVQLLEELQAYRADILSYQPGRSFVQADAAAELTALFLGEAWLEQEEAQRTGDEIADAEVYGGPAVAGADDFSRYPNDFHTRYVEFPDMFQLALFAGTEGQHGLAISAGVKRVYFQNHVPASNLYAVDRVEDDALIENYMVRSGYLAWRTGPFEFRFGRSPVHYGDTRFSTFLPSQKLPWLDTFSYRYQTGPLTMTSYFGTLENRATEAEKALFGIGSGGALDENGGYVFDTEKGQVGFSDDGELLFFDDENLEDVSESDQQVNMAFSDTIILSSMHRFMFAWEKLRFGVTAHSLVSREANALSMGDIFPVFSWHNAYVGHHNMHMVLEAGYSPLPGLGLYGQAAWDDINAQDLIGIKDSGVPTIGAYLAGISWDGRITNAVELSAKLELGSTHFLWGNYYAYQPVKGGYFERAIYRYQAKEGIYWMPLTSPYGPGAAWIDGEADLQLPGNLDAALGGTWLSINSAADLLTLPYEGSESLNDAPRIHSYSVWFSLDWEIPIFPKKLPDASSGGPKKAFSGQLNIGIQPIFYSYNEHVWPELELSAGMQF